MAQRAYVRFYASLNDFIEPRNRGRTVVHTFEIGGPAKDVIESVGVPHTEIELLVINGEQGSAKSTLCRAVKQLIDPRAAGALRAAPRDETRPRSRRRTSV